MRTRKKPIRKNVNYIFYYKTELFLLKNLLYISIIMNSAIRDEDLRYMTKKAYNDKYYAKIRAKRLEMNRTQPKKNYMHKALIKFEKEDNDYVKKLIDIIGTHVIQLALDEIKEE